MHVYLWLCRMPLGTNERQDSYQESCSQQHRQHQQHQHQHQHQRRQQHTNINIDTNHDNERTVAATATATATTPTYVLTVPGTGFNIYTTLREYNPYDDSDYPCTANTATATTKTTTSPATTRTFSKQKKMQPPPDSLNAAPPMRMVCESRRYY